jgi:hypothetical protein
MSLDANIGESFKNLNKARRRGFTIDQQWLMNI